MSEYLVIISYRGRWNHHNFKTLHSAREYVAMETGGDIHVIGLYKKIGG